MNRRSILQGAGVTTLALLGSCLGRTETEREYPTLLDLASGEVTDGTAPASSSTGNPPSDGSRNSDSDGGSTDDPAGGSDGDADSGKTDGSGDNGSDGSDGESSDPPPAAGDRGVDTEAFLAAVADAGIERGAVDYGYGVLTVSFRSSAGGGGEPTDEIATVLRAISDSIYDTKTFNRSVNWIDLVVGSPDGSRERAIGVDPDWALSYREGAISMDAYLERIREKGALRFSHRLCPESTVAERSVSRIFT